MSPEEPQLSAGNAAPSGRFLPRTGRLVVRLLKQSRNLNGLGCSPPLHSPGFLQMAAGCKVGLVRESSESKSTQLREQHNLGATLDVWKDKQYPPNRKQLICTQKSNFPGGNIS